MGIQVSSSKKRVPIDSIVVPSCFGTPKLDKILEHHTKCLIDNVLEPIIVNDRMNLIDGYCSLLILKHHGHDFVDVYQIHTREHDPNSGLWMRKDNGEIYCSVCLNVDAVVSNPDDVADAMAGVHFCSSCGSRNYLED